MDGADRFARGVGMPASLAGVVILRFATAAPLGAATAPPDGAAGAGAAALPSTGGRLPVDVVKVERPCGAR